MPLDNKSIALSTVCVRRLLTLKAVVFTFGHKSSIPCKHACCERHFQLPVNFRPRARGFSPRGSHGLSLLAITDGAGLRLLAHKLVNIGSAAVALHITTPMELTVTALGHGHFEVVVATSTAHKLTAIHSR